MSDLDGLNGLQDGICLSTPESGTDFIETGTGSIVITGTGTFITEPDYDYYCTPSINALIFFMIFTFLLFTQILNLIYLLFSHPYDRGYDDAMKSLEDRFCKNCGVRMSIGCGEIKDNKSNS